MDASEADVVADTAFPREHWRQIWSTNPLERVRPEIKRRTNVVGIFPNAAAIVRLVGAVLLEQHEAWPVGRRSVSVEARMKLQREGSPALLTPAAADEPARGRPHVGGGGGHAREASQLRTTPPNAESTPSPVNSRPPAVIRLPAWGSA
jgi:hypothetical protein